MLSTITMFKASNIWRMSIININCFKHFDMFFIEATDNLFKLFVSWWTFSGIVLFFNGRLWEFFFIDRQFAGNFLFFYFSPFDKMLMRGTWFLRQPVIFINKACDKISNRNIPNPNEDNRQLLARLWDAVKRRGDGKCYCSCTQCRGFKRRRILISTATKHCREHGHAEGGNKYRPFVGLAL